MKGPRGGRLRRPEERLTNEAGENGLSRVRLKRARESLHWVAEEARVPIWQYAAFVAAQVFAYAIPPLVLLHLLADLIAHSMPALGTLSAWFEGITWPLAVFLGLLLFPTAPLAWRAVRQRLVGRRMRALGLFEKRRRARSRRATSRRRAWLTLTAPSLLAVPAAYSLVRWLAGEPIQVPWSTFLVGCLLTIALPFALFSLDLLLDRLRSRLVYADEMSRLVEALREVEESGEGSEVRLRLDLLRTATTLERNGILEDRVWAGIRRSARRRHYAIARDEAFRQRLDELEPIAALRVEQAILGLGRKPVPRPAVLQLDGKTHHLPVAGTELALVYSVDRRHRCVTCHSLRGPSITYRRVKD